MGRPQQPDEHLPEVVQHRPPLTPNAHGDHLPEVVPDTSPEAAQPRYFMEPGKYPAQYDNAPKFLHEEPTTPGMSPGQQYQPPWGPGSIGGGDYHSVSALSPNSAVPWHSFPGADDQQTYVGSEPETEKRICGLRKRLFIIIAVILGIVVVVAAVGGGVGGAMATRQADEAAPAATNSASASASTDSPTGTTASGETSTSTTSSAPAATATDLTQTDPTVFEMFEFQGWAEANYTGETTGIFKEPGYYDFNISVLSYYWIHDKTDCCVTFCTSHEDSEQYWCDPVRKPITTSGKGFTRVSLWCGNRLNEDMQKRCSG